MQQRGYTKGLASVARRRRRASWSRERSVGEGGGEILVPPESSWAGGFGVLVLMEVK